MLNEVIEEFLELARPEIPAGLHLILAVWEGTRVVHLTATDQPLADLRKALRAINDVVAWQAPKGGG